MSVDAYFVEEQIASWPDLILILQSALGFIWNYKMSSDMGSDPDPQSAIAMLHFKPVCVSNRLQYN